ncbi:ferredoxin [Sorangium sp. So ce1128]
METSSKLDAEPPQEQLAAVREAVAVCPGAALRLSEGAG